MLPVGALPRKAESFAPELIESELLPDLGEQPASTPLPRPVQRKIPQPHLDSVGRGLRQRELRGEELELPCFTPIFVKDFDGSNPLLLLAVVDLSQIQH